MLWLSSLFLCKWTLFSDCLQDIFFPFVFRSLNLLCPDIFVEGEMSNGSVYPAWRVSEIWCLSLIFENSQQIFIKLFLLFYFIFLLLLRFQLHLGLYWAHWCCTSAHVWSVLFFYYFSFRDAVWVISFDLYSNPLILPWDSADEPFKVILGSLLPYFSFFLIFF